MPWPQEISNNNAVAGLVSFLIRTSVNNMLPTAHFHSLSRPPLFSTFIAIRRPSFSSASLCIHHSFAPSILAIDSLLLITIHSAVNPTATVCRREIVHSSSTLSNPSVQKDSPPHKSDATKSEINENHTPTTESHALNFTPPLAIQDDIQPSILKDSDRCNDACRRNDLSGSVNSTCSQIITRSREKVQMPVLQ